MWDILLATEEVAIALAGNGLTTKNVRFQTVYMGTRKTWVTLHGVTMYIFDDHLVEFWTCG